VDPLVEMMPSFGGYTYNFNNPIRYTDPTGMMPEESGGGGDGKGFKGSGTDSDPFQMNEITISVPKIISRDKWGAKAPITEGRDYFPIDGDLGDYYDSIAIHHSGNTDSPSIADIQKKHHESGEADVGYHYAIDSNGVIYEGRPLGIVGSHIAMANSNVIGIVLLGDYHKESFGNSEKLSQKSLISLKNLIKYLHNKYDVSNGINGHNGFNCGGYTECPGNKLEKWIPIIAEKLGLPLAKCKTTGGDKLILVNK
jgi:hypothetical protein